MTNIIDLSEARKQKKEKDHQDSLKKLPVHLIEYFKLRQIQVEEIEKMLKTVDDFEKNHLTFSKNKHLTGPEIDFYLSNKSAIEYAKETIRISDFSIKQTYPEVELPQDAYSPKY